MMAAVLKKNTPLGIIEVNGAFHHYADRDTDTMWLGFALGMRAAERVAQATAIQFLRMGKLRPARAGRRGCRPDR